jgi:hypothetical protein
MCMYIYTDICIHVYIYVYMCIFLHAYNDRYAFGFIYTYIYILGPNTENAEKWYNSLLVCVDRANGKCGSSK